MILDYNPSTGAYYVRVPRASKDVKLLMNEHGLDFSKAASTRSEAVLMTHQPYAAVAFAASATDRAHAQLAEMIHEIDASRALSSDAHIRVPADKELWGFQKASIEYALRRKHALIGDQPGLGKTPIAICYANEIGAKRVLVVCPASIRLQWVQRIQEWSTMEWPYHIHPILSARNGVNPYAQWTVVSYELARSVSINRALAAGRYDVIILDEAHYLKTVDARRTRAIFGGGERHDIIPLTPFADHVLALTGTPLPNRPREAYTLARGLCWDSIDWASEDAFKERFNPSFQGEYTNPETGLVKLFIDERNGRHAELQARLRYHFMARHLKRDVMPQLQMPAYDIIVLEETKAVKAALQKESLLDFDPEKYNAHLEVIGDISTVRKDMGLAIAPQVADYIDMLIDGGEEKLVVFAWHIEVLDILEAAWERHGVVRVDGRTGAVTKQRLVNRFRTDPKCQVILGNSLSLGTGTDGLQDVASHALIAEPDWTPGVNIQCFDRLDRGGQTRKVQGDIFVAPRSIAEKILGNALRKLQITNKVLDKEGF